jgi:hypothetical protein
MSFGSSYYKVGLWIWLHLSNMPSPFEFAFAFWICLDNSLIDQRVWVCIECARTDNAEEVKRRWPGRWGNVPSPSRQAIKIKFDKFLREGTCLNFNKGRSGHMRTARTRENINFVRQSLEENRRCSTRRNSLGLSRSTFHRIVKNDIKFHLW